MHKHWRHKNQLLANIYTRKQFKTVIFTLYFDLCARFYIVNARFFARYYMLHGIKTIFRLSDHPTTITPPPLLIKPSLIFI